MPRQSVTFTAYVEASGDNQAMDKDRDLLPWILGGLSMATAAIAITVASTNRTARVNLQAPSQPAAYALPPVPAENAPAPAAALAAVQVQTITPPKPPTNQIWECTTNGQKTFSNNPCGDKSSLREVGPINTMDPTPIFAPARSYEPQSSYQPEYSYPSTQESADTSYPMVVASPFYERRLPVHTHRPHDHDRGPPPRRN
jgi:hypothetical protein